MIPWIAGTCSGSIHCSIPFLQWFFQTTTSQKLQFVQTHCGVVCSEHAEKNLVFCAVSRTHTTARLVGSRSATRAVSIFSGCLSTCINRHAVVCSICSEPSARVDACREFGTITGLFCTKWPMPHSRNASSAAVALLNVAGRSASLMWVSNLQSLIS